MAEALVIARVAAIQGEVFARSPDGKVRRLQVNDPIREGDVVTPGQGGRVELALADGTTRLVKGGEQLTVDAEVAGEVKPDARDAALVTGKGEIDKVIKAINSGGSLDELLEETAAGEAAGTDGGSSFVRLVRVTENVDPLSFQFSSTQRNTTDDFFNGGGVTTAPSLIVNDGNSLDPGQATVYERGLLSGADKSETTTGTVTVNTPGGLIALTIGGVSFTAAQLASPAYLAANPINTGEGTLTLTGFNPATGTLSYSYTLNGPVNQPGVTESIDSIALTVSSPGGTVGGTLSIRIVDTEPVANADANAISEDAAPNAVSGNVFSNDAIGADVTATPVTPTAGAVTLTYGSLILNATGSYTYTLNNGLPATQALAQGQVVTDTYTYTITDADGDTSTATLAITINGTNDVPVITNAATQLAGTVTEAGHLDDGTAVAGTATVSGTLSASDVDTGATQNWTLQGVPSTTYGTMALNAGTGQWTYSLNNGLAATQALKEGQSVTQTYTARVTDDFGAYVDQTITVTINGTNDVPVITNAATQLAGTVTEAGHLDDGTAVAGTATVSGTLSASDVDTGATQNWTLQGVPSTTYGTMALNAGTGQWTYSLNNGLAATQALKEGQSVTQTYTARVTDDFGAYVDQTITVTINGTNDVPVITNAATQLAGTVTEAGHLDDGTAVAGTATVSGTLSASDVDTGATQNWTLQGVPSTTYGTMALNAGTGQWTYSLNNGLAATQALKEGQSVTQTYTARVTDDFGAYVDQTITVTINGTNDVPVITNAATQLAGTVTEAGHLDDGTAVAGTATVSGTLSASDVDTGATQNWTLQGVPSTTYGTMALNAGTGQWTYSLNNGLAATQALKEGQSVTQTYTARVTDDFGAYVDQTITVTINGTNDVPVITNAATQLAGTVTEAGHLDDGTAVAGTATVSGTLSASDVDTGATQNWTLQGVPSTTYGTMALNAGTGQWTYSLNNGLAATQALKEGQSVTQTYTARVTDDFGAYVDQTITVTINGTNDVPVITNAATQLAGTVTEAGHLDDGTAVAGTATVSGTLSASDVDTGATQNWTLQGVPSTTYGTMALNAGTGQWTYSLNNGLAATQALKEGQSVTQTYTARVTDDFGAYVDQTITVTINGTNDVPVITNAATQLAGTVTEAGHLDDGTAVAGTATVSGTLSASDVDTGATQNWTLQGVPSTTYGTMALNAGTGQWTYSLNNGLAATQALKEGQSVTQTYTARVTDDFGAYVDQTITVTIVGTNDVPVITNAATQLAGTVTEAGHLDDGTAVAGTATVSGTLSASDVDTGATQNWTLQGVPSTTYGTMALNAGTGQWTYSLNNGLAATQALKEGQSVTQTYTARVTDDFGAYVDQTITVTIVGTNDVPVITNAATQLAGTVTEAGHLDDGTAVAGTATVSGTLSASDVDTGATQNWTLQGVPSTTYGTMALNAGTGQWTYSLNNGLAATQALKEGQSVTQTYTARVTDDFGAYVDQTITVTINGTNDVPVITNAATQLAGTVTEAGHLDDGTAVAGTATVSGTLSASDVDTGATQNWTLQGVPSTTYGTMALNAGTGQWTYSLNNGLAATQALKEGQSVTQTYTARVTDDFGAYVDQTITVTIVGTNDGPVITNAATQLAGTVTEAGHLDDGTAVAGTATVSGTLSASDVDTGATQTWTLQGVPSTTYGTMALNAGTGQWTYSLNNGLAATQALKEGQSVTQTYTARVTDDFGAYVDQTITVTIVGTNDAPIAVADIVGVTEDAVDQIGYSDGTANTTTVGGNVLTNDTDVDLGDTRSVTGVAAGTPATASGNVATGVAGTYGTVTITADGSYNYKLDNTKPSVQALAQGQKVTDTFTYTITDAQGAISTTTLTVTVTGSNDAPDITVGAGDSVAAGLTETNSGLTASGTLSIFDVDTQDTVAPSVTTVTASGTYAGLGSLSSQVTNAQLLAMLTVSGGELSTLLQSAPNGIGWNFNSGSQAFNFIPAGQTLVLTYNVRATDSSGAANNTDNQAVTITITGTNDGVTINNDIKSIAENANAAARSGNVLTNDIVDPDFGETTIIKSFSVDRNGDGIQDTYTPTAAGTSVTITSASGGTLGVFTMASNGSYSFVPQLANYSGAVPTITYTAGRAGTLADSGTATLNITVTPVSDAPGVTRDAATVITNEDTAVALGLNAPTVTDRIDQNGAAAGDNPERLSVISLTGIPSGVRLLDGTSGDATLFTSTGGTITIRLSDATNLIASPGAATLTMTTAQFEALKLLPAAHSATNFTVTMRVTEYEVDNAGNPLSGVAGAAATTTVVNNVLAVTDPIDLRIAGGNGPHSVSINEDAPLNLTSLLSATFQDLDGSERRDIIIANPVGNGTIFVNGNAVTAGSSYTIAWNAAGNNLETSQAGFPAISITTAPNFSGDLNGITVTLSARDSDSDSPTATPLTLTDSVTLNLFVRPVAGDVTIAPVSTPEDTGVRFLNALSLTDTDGSEAITGITVNAVPAGWVIRDELGVVVFTGNGAAAYTVPAGEVTNGDFRNYTITPAAHNSTDRTLAIAVQTTDTRIVNGVPVTSTVTTTVNQTITVTAVAERIGTDSNADGTPDLTMNASFNYTTAGAEDQWFALSTNGFDFRTPWTNQDADGSERTFALVTPVLSGGSAIGSQFQYTLGGVTTTLTYTGTALQIPMEALSTVQFKAAPNIAGSFEIQVQALTIDTDPNTGASVQAISGSATLTSLVIAPVADAVTLAVDAPAVGLEDTAIPLVIRPTSADPSETFIVTVSGIPSGAKIYYGGVELTVAGGSVSIANFSTATLLTITPPLNSNVDIPLSVSAVSVDTFGAYTSTSVASTLPLLVDVRGVADPVSLVVQSPLQTTEATVDGGSRRIALSGAITSVTPVDNDGSESVTVVVSGVPVGFRLEGLTFMGGVGTDRIWSGTPAEISTAKLVVSDANFSGTINLTVRAVSTENDGNSLAGATIPLTIQVTPSPEAAIAVQTDAAEDTLTQVNFAIQPQNGDGNETLHSVWIDANSLAGKPFALYLGGTLLSAALPASGGWYKLDATQAANVFVKGEANSDADGSFIIKYEIRDPSSDGTLPATITQFDGTHTVNVSAVTDATVSTNDYAGGVVGTTTTLEVNVTVTQQNDANAGGAKDVDGSERLLYFIVDNVPIGVTVEGGRYIGNTSVSANTGRWILDTPDVAFNSAALNQPIRFALDGTATQLSGLNQPITIIAYTQDTGGAERTSSTSWTLQTAPVFIDTSPLPTVPAATITHWVPDPVSVSMTEDAPTTLNALVDAQISGASPYAVTITGLPAGTVVAGMMQTVIGGQTIWTAQGNGNDASLQALLSSITITPPPNWNANQGAFSFSTTLTTYDDGGGRHDSSFALTPAVTPVSDPIVLTSADTDIAEDTPAAITLTLANPADGTNSHVVGGKVYVQVDESAMEATGGALSFGGSPVALTAVSGVPGVPDGNYFVLTGVGSSAMLALSYQPAANASGVVAYTAYVQGQETGASNVTTTSVAGSFVVSPVDDGVVISAPPVIGLEDQRIPLSIGVSLTDTKETIASVTLTNVPDGFLVFAGAGSPGSMATNLGGGVWGISLIGGAVPSYLALQPPINWSGTLSNLQIGVWSGEAGLDPVLTTALQSVTINGVADGIGLTPTLSFGNEGQIVALNLNSTMPDHDGSETATLSFKGLGEYATFFAGSTPLTASYVVATDTYTLSGLTSAQVASLGVSQQDGHYDLTVTAFTTDSPGANVSSPVSASLSLDISPIVSSPANDILTGTAGADRIIGGAGNDTMTGGLGADVFAWKFGDQGSPGTPAVDRITDFNNVAGDMNNKLDLRDLLQGENHTSGTGNLANFLHFEKSGSDTIVHVSSSGAFSSGYSASNENQTIILQNVDLSAGGLNTDQLIIQDLLNKGRLQTD